MAGHGTEKRFDDETPVTFQWPLCHKDGLHQLSAGFIRLFLCLGSFCIPYLFTSQNPWLEFDLLWLNINPANEMDMYSKVHLCFSYNIDSFMPWDFPHDSSYNKTSGYKRKKNLVVLIHVQYTHALWLLLNKILHFISPHCDVSRTLWNSLLGVYGFLCVNRLPSPLLANLVTWVPNFIQLTASRRALWREEKKTTREKLVFSTFRN